MTRHRMLLLAGWILPLILAGLFFVKGQHYDPDFFEPPDAAAFALPVPQGIGEWILQDAQSLPADRMFEKINGKADYYLQYGAVELCCGEWITDGHIWDMYLYRFAEGQGARGGYTGERPSDGRAIEGLDGYTVPGQAAFVTGVFYMQLSARTADADTGAIVDLALALAPFLRGSTSAVQDETKVNLTALAADSMIDGSEGFLPENAFGFSVLSDVQTIQVSLEGAEAIWFMAAGDTNTVEAFTEELALYGGEDLFNDDGVSGGSMFGSWSLSGILNGTVWGIHNAPSREALLQHWESLKQKVEEL